MLAVRSRCKKGIQPEGNPNYYYVNVEGRPGATLADMRQTVDRLAKLLLAAAGDRARLHRRSAAERPSGGPAAASSARPASTQGAVVAILKPDRNGQGAARSATGCAPCCAQIPDAPAVTFDTSGFGVADVQVILTSETGEGLDAAALELQREMRGVHGLADPRPATPPPGARAGRAAQGPTRPRGWACRPPTIA